MLKFFIGLALLYKSFRKREILRYIKAIQGGIPSQLQGHKTSTINILVSKRSMDMQNMLNLQ